MKEFITKLQFYLRIKLWAYYQSIFRKIYWRCLGAHVGKETLLHGCSMTWPHKVKIGNQCIVESDIFFKHDGIYSPGKSIIIGNNTFIGKGCEFNITSEIKIGNDCLIASGCKFVDHNHGKDLKYLMRKQRCQESPISIGDNVWLGVNVVVLKGVEISNGAIVAANAVVNKSIPENEIWAGIPAKKIGERV